MAQYAANEIENMPDSPVARDDLGAGGTSRGAGARSPLFWKVLLLSVAIIWGYSFTTMKDALDTIPVFELLYVRFLPAALVMFVIFRKRIAAHLNARNLIVGLSMGALMWAAYALQTVGLAQTTAGKNAFLTGTYCILVPFASYFLSGEKLTRYNLGAALLCLAGIGLVALDSVEFNIGDAITLGGAVFFAIQMAVTAKYGRKMDINVITFWMFVGNGVLSLISSLLFETQAPLSVWTPSFIGVMAFLSAGCTCVALLIQNVGLAHVPASTGSLLLSMESPSGVLFSVLLMGEALTSRLLAGFVLIFLSIVLSETHFDFLRRNNCAQLSTTCCAALLGRRFLCNALTVMPCTLDHQSVCCTNNTGGHLWHQLSPIFNRNQRPRPPRQRKPLSVTVLLPRLKLLPTSLLRGATTCTRRLSWAIAFRKPLRISRHV